MPRMPMASMRYLWPLTGIRLAGQRTVAPDAAAETVPSCAGMLTPTWITADFRESTFAPSDAAICSPLREIKRTNRACPNLTTSRLFKQISERWAVQLHGVWETMPAIMPIVAGVDSQ